MNSEQVKKPVEKTLPVSTFIPKPIDRWLGLGIGIVGLVFWLLPKTPGTIITCLFRILAMAIHPTWNFWWIETALWRRIMSIIGACIVLALIGWKSWPIPDPLAKDIEEIKRAVAVLAENSKEPQQVTLPGISVQALIDIGDSHAQGRKYIWDVGTSTGARESIYISEEGLLTFAVVDNKGELYAVHSQLEKDKIPVNKVFFLACQLGISGTGTIMSIVANGKTLDSKEFPVRMEVDLRNAPGGRIGGDINDSNFGTFRLYELAFYNRTLTVDEMHTNATAFANDHPGLVYDVREFNSRAVPVESVIH